MKIAIGLLILSALALSNARSLTNSEEKLAMTQLIGEILQDTGRVPRTNQCSPVTCLMLCKHGFKTDLNGCSVCECNPPPTCLNRPQCIMRCPYGRMEDSDGCPLCQCRTTPPTGAQSVPDVQVHIPEITKKTLNDLTMQLETILDGTNTNINQDRITFPTTSINYVRWGRTTCPTTSRTLYTGITATKTHNQPGTKNNFLCLHENSKFQTVNTQGRMGDLNNHRTHESLIFNPERLHPDTPCTVCEVPSHSQTLMIPDRETCPTGWTKEYTGLLMSLPTQTDVICVSNDRESLPTGLVTKHGAPLFVVQTECRTSPCQTPINTLELPCVVCTK